MSAERKKILEMLAEGIITPDDADKLLEKLAGPEPQDATREDRAGSKPRFMRIVVDRPGQDQVNIRMPLSFMRTKTNLLAVLPSRVAEKLAERGLDISALLSMDPKEWENAVENMNIEIEKGNGKNVKIFCE